jgi:hypothetical protein
MRGAVRNKILYCARNSKNQDFTIGFHTGFLYACKLSKIFGKIQVSMALFLSSEIHQGDDLFSVQSRGKQCAFMSLSAILTAQNIPLIDWSKTTLNNVRVKSNRDQHPPPGNPRAFDLTLPPNRREFDGPVGHLTT